MISKKKSFVINEIFLIAVICLVVAFLFNLINLILYVIIGWSLVLVLISLWVVDLHYQYK